MKKGEAIMDSERTIDAIRTLLNKLPSQEKSDQLQIYITIKFLSNELSEYAKEKKLPYLYIKGIIRELDNHCRCIVDLEDKFGHSMDQYQSWARAAVRKLESNHCFAIK